MPVGFLTEDQQARYGRFSGEPTPDQLARHFHLDDADRAFIAEHRGDHNRLGVAVQLGTVRLLGTFLEDLSQTPASAILYAADQMLIAHSAPLMTLYGASAGRWRHGGRIRKRYGYRVFTDFGVAFRLNRFLYALCWTGTERPKALFERAIVSFLSLFFWYDCNTALSARRPAKPALLRDVNSTIVNFPSSERVHDHAMSCS